jgi:hypothetical protein
MSLRIITAKAFSAAITTDDADKIINAPKNFRNFIGQPFYVLEQVIRKNKFQLITVENVEETE